MPIKRAYRKKRGMKKRARVPRSIYNARPAFTETFRFASDLLPNAGFLLTANMDNIPQLAQYEGLYQQYRIMRCTFMLLPTWTGGELQNSAIFNSASGPTLPPGLTSVGTSRMVSVIDSSPNQTVPVSEASVLQENGCRVRFIDKMVKLSCGPVPDLKDANNNQLTIRGKFQNFTSPNVAHYGIRGWITQPQSVGATGSTAITYAVYAKLSFQLREPR
jgi:hypothetical protein